MPYFTSGGHRLHYREQGNGPLLLLLPGNSASGAHMQGELDYFMGRYHAVALDFLGTGRSERLAVWPDDWWARAAEDAATLMTHLGESSCVAMGTSGGAVVALLLAAISPERVQAVVADSFIGHWQPPALRALVAGRPLADAHAAHFWQYGHGEDWRQVVEADSALLERLAERGGDVLGGALARIGCPTLFTGSLRDDLLPNVAEETCSMARQVAGSHVYFADSGNHPLMWSRPQAFRRAAGCFLDCVMAPAGSQAGLAALHEGETSGDNGTGARHNRCATLA
jgi:valacyclovir hydrolase